jgi:hypothetical protein
MSIKTVTFAILALALALFAVRSTVVIGGTDRGLGYDHFPVEAP